MITYRLIDGHWLIDRDDVFIACMDDETMLRVCCVCHAVLGTLKARPGVSHGYCPDCFKEEMEKLNEE